MIVPDNPEWIEVVRILIDQPKTTEKYLAARLTTSKTNVHQKMFTTIRKYPWIFTTSKTAPSGKGRPAKTYAIQWSGWAEYLLDYFAPDWKTVQDKMPDDIRTPIEPMLKAAGKIIKFYVTERLNESSPHTIHSLIKEFHDLITSEALNGKYATIDYGHLQASHAHFLRYQFILQDAHILSLPGWNAAKKALFKTNPKPHFLQSS